jgi:diguanylate cyclase (GGDEF)-like protein
VNNLNDGKFSILIVDDNNQNLQVLADILEGCGYETGFAMNGKQALNYIKHEKPDLILLDVMMPEMDGYAACTNLKKNPEYSDIPVIFLTAKVEIEDIVKGFEVGGVDYISKPFNAVELKSRVKTHLELKRSRDEIRESYNELREAKNLIDIQHEKLNDIMKKLEILSNTDPLTELFNRRYIIKAMELEEEKCKTNNSSFTIVMGDIDFFKSVNDTCGHDCGDTILKDVSKIINSLIRNSDVLARWGGEEFLIMFTDHNVKNTDIITERIRKEINDHVFISNETKINLTMTFGISEFKKGDSLDDVIKRADNALYEGKRAGRNTVITG